MESTSEISRIAVARTIRLAITSSTIWSVRLIGAIVGARTGYRQLPRPPPRGPHEPPDPEPRRRRGWNHAQRGHDPARPLAAEVVRDQHHEHGHGQGGLDAPDG